jgi:hypothetical protein
MPIKDPCRFCGKPQGAPLAYGHYDLLEDEVSEMVDRRDVMLAGDAIMIDENGRRMDTGCLSCGSHWIR